MKRIVTNLAICISLLIPGSVFAGTISDFGGVDVFLGKATLKNSGDSTELAWVRDLLGNQSIQMDEKYSSSGSDWTIVDGESDIFSSSLLQSPGYFLLKFGTGNTGIDSHFLFENVGDLNFGVIDFSDMGIELSTNKKFNISKISHINEFSGLTSVSVPEPLSTTLLSLGIFAFGMSRKLKKGS